MLKNLELTLVKDLAVISRKQRNNLIGFKDRQLKGILLNKGSLKTKSNLSKLILDGLHLRKSLARLSCKI